MKKRIFSERLITKITSTAPIESGRHKIQFDSGELITHNLQELSRNGIAI